MHTHTHPTDRGLILSTVLHYMVCMPCSMWSPLRRETFVTAHGLKSECHLWLCNTGVCCRNPWPPKSRWCAVTDCRPPLWGLSELEGMTASQEFRNIWVCFPSCMKGLVLYSGNVILQLWKNYILIKGTVLLMVANLDFVYWVDSIVVNVSAWIDELKISLYFC